MQHLSQFRSFRSIVKQAFLLTLVLCSGGTTFADEPIVEFLEGLRERKYYDTAIEYLDQLEKRTDLAPETRSVLSLQRGLTHEAAARSSRVIEDRELALGKAELAFRDFLQKNPNHSQAAFVNSQLGTLLFERARSILWDADAASNADKRPDMQKKARGLIDQAEKIFQTSHDQYKAKWKAFPPSIDPDKEPEQFEARKRADAAYLRSWFNLVRATYQRGQTFNEGTKERKDTLLQASKKFEEIHTARRSNPIGLQSRLMMGKCFQEQNDIDRALGLYNEVMSHRSREPIVLQLKSNATQFRLICLNHESKKDYQLVLQEADEWLNNKDYRRFVNGEIGLGIRWERAQALEKLSQDRTVEESAQKNLTRSALAEAKKIALYPSPYRAAASAMSRRLQAALGSEDQEPTDFPTAFERAKALVSQLSQLNDKIKAAKTNSDKRQAQQEKQRQLDEIGRLLQLALQLRKADTEPEAVAQARYLLSYVYMSQRKSFDAIILARYCMTRDRIVAPETAQDATEIAIQSAVQAFNDANDDQAFELQLLKDICETIIELYPNGSRGNEARYRLGKVYRDLNQPAEAATAFLEIPRESPEYASSRIQAGQSFWLAWAQTKANNSGTETTSEQESQLTSWKQDAEKHLQEGLSVAGKTLGDKQPPTPEMVAAEVTLATILNLDGKFDQTIKRLTEGGANSVVAATQPGKGKRRPEKGIQSPVFAGQMWRLLLRAYVGTQQIDKALNAMSQLEAVGGQDTAAVYTELGQELQQELARLKQAGESERLQQVRESFEQFLAKVYEQRDQTDYNSLLWIGETYYSLGQGVGTDDQVAADEYFQKASQAYSEILENDLADDATATAVKLRLIRCRRALREYESAVEMAKQILADRPMQLDVQFEAAYTLSDWGADPGAAQPDRLKEAISGVKDANDQKVIWGWQTLVTRLNNRQGTDEWEALKPRFLDAGYESLRSRLLLAETGIPEKQTLLSGAKAQAEIFAVVNFDPQPKPGGKVPDDEADFQRFNRLYEKIQVALGEAPQSLQRDTRVEVPVAPVVQQSEADASQDDNAKANQTAETPAEPEPANYLMITLAMALAAGGAAGFYKVMSKPASRKKLRYTPSEAPLPPPDTGVDDGPSSENSDVPDFSAFAGVGAPSTKIAPPKKSVSGRTKPSSKPAAEASEEPKVIRKKVPRPPEKRVPQDTDATAGAAPAQKKRRALTEEEMARFKAARMAKAKEAAKKAAAEGKSPEEQQAIARQVLKQKPTTEEIQAFTGKKVVRKKPPKPPES